MMGKTHKVGGAISGFSILTVINFVNVTINPIFVGIPFLAGNIIGSFLPDIDQRKSTISRKVWFVAWPIWLLQSILNFIFKKSKSELAKAIKTTVNHRGFAHWPSIYVFGIIVIFIITNLFSVNTSSLTFESIHTSLISLVGSSYDSGTFIRSLTITVLGAFFYGVCFGAINHIILDSFNPSGVPLFAPFSLERKSYGTIITGAMSKKEKRFRKILKIILVVVIFLFIYSLLENLNISFIQNLGPSETNLINPL